MSSDIRIIIKDSLFTGLISLALFGPIVGLKTFSKTTAYQETNFEIYLK